MNEEKTQLKPCPFCGCTPGFDNTDERARVHCTGCGTEGGLFFFSQEEYESGIGDAAEARATEQWNRRASPSVNEEKTEAAGGVGSSQPERFTDQAKPRQCWAVEMGWERKACETPCAMKKCNPAGVMASDGSQPE